MLISRISLSGHWSLANSFEALVVLGCVLDSWRQFFEVFGSNVPLLCLLV
jgi:hypothetical protein